MSQVETKALAKKIRIEALKMTSMGGSSHIGSIFSIVDLLAVLYGSILKFDKNKPTWKGRDRFILSKGHAGAGVYVALAEVGFIKKDQLKTHYKDGSYLSGHISHKGIPGVEVSTGSLGHGLSIGVGMAKAAKLSSSTHNTYVLLSDGECDEGSVWEAAMFANHHKLNNLIAIIDYNKLQSLDTVEKTLALEPFNQKWESFGWNVIEIDGHDHGEIKLALSNNSKLRNAPTVVIANTIKGKGVSFMENQVLWHYRTATGKEYDAAQVELEKE
jgi:transketolase